MIDYSYTELGKDVIRIFKATEASRYPTEVAENNYFYAEDTEEPAMFMHHLKATVYEAQYDILTERLKKDFLQYAERWDSGEFRKDILPYDVPLIQADIDFVRSYLENGAISVKRDYHNVIPFDKEVESIAFSADKEYNREGPKKSLVQVYFEYKELSLTYFNDCFDIRVGNGVYVDGKLSGHLGVVTCVNYNFKIDVNRYQRVISVVDTRVSGTLRIMDLYLIAFEPYVIPAEKIFPWYFEPVDDRNVWMECGYDDRRITLYDLSGLNADRAEIDKGLYMYESNAVRYLSYVNGAVRAIVRDNTRLYTVECEYRDGDIMKLTCDCYNAFDCKHEIAVLTLLREVLDKYGVGEKGYFAVINKQDFFEKANVSSQTGTINIE